MPHGKARKVRARTKESDLVGVAAKRYLLEEGEEEAAGTSFFGIWKDQVRGEWGYVSGWTMPWCFVEWSRQGVGRHCMRTAPFQR